VQLHTKNLDYEVLRHYWGLWCR